MTTTEELHEAGTAWHHEAAEQLRSLKVFGEVPTDELATFVQEASSEQVEAGVTISEEDQPYDLFLVLLEGKVEISKRDQQGNPYMRKTVGAPSYMGEVPLLTGLRSQMGVRTVTAVHALRFERQAFWNAMTRCPAIRQAIQEEAALRLLGMQKQQTQQEKMAMLGTMTAGLMHELNNPGAAARRAASQLRSNLQRMHELARSFSEQGHTPEQRARLSALQDRVLQVKGAICLGSLQQADAEEALGEWMDEHEIEAAWEFAPVLVSSGIKPQDLEDLASVFPEKKISEPVQWLEATASSMQMVGLVEESVARVAELAQAVKSYAHEGQAGVQELDVNESIHATMVMLKHKFREKNIRLQKDFGGGLPKLHCVCSGLNQVWTNILDNAIDAVNAGGAIGVKTSQADGEIHVAITDNGQGITPQDQERIFEPFFTTKAAGIGSGLGLGIVQRILESYHGRITLQSRPGQTEFVVHIPI